MSVHPPPWRTDGESLRLTVKALPRSRSVGANGIVPIGGAVTALAVKLRSPPADGAANAELISYLAKALNVASSRVSLVAGAASRIKQVRVDGDSSALEQALEKLAGLH